MCLEVRGLRPNWSGYKPALSSGSDACLPDGASNGSTLQTLALPSRAVCSGVSSPSFSPGGEGRGGRCLAALTPRGPWSAAADPWAVSLSHQLMAEAPRWRGSRLGW